MFPAALPQPREQKARFEKNPGRWVATPQFLTELHRLLNEKLDRIAGEPAFSPGAHRPATAPTGDLHRRLRRGLCPRLGASSIPGTGGKIDLYQVRLAYPAPPAVHREIRKRYEKVLVLEETDRGDRDAARHGRVSGRRSGDVPRQGELTPDIIEAILRKDSSACRPLSAAGPTEGTPPGPPCAPAAATGRPSMRSARPFPEGIFPSDIGCYTLGMNLGVVDTCHCMGAGLSQGAGFYHAYAASGDQFPTIVATIGDSTFFHAGLPALINAVFHGARIILVILDNATTAMTGHQPTPEVGLTASGAPGHPVSILELVLACGWAF